MRTIGVLLLISVLLTGCSRNEPDRPARPPIRVESLAIVARGGERSYMQSDREGGFLVGVVGGRADADRWTVEGLEVVRGLVIETPDGTLTADRLDSARILPYATEKFYAGGTEVVLSVLEGVNGIRTHGFGIRVRSGRPGRTTVRVLPGSDLRTAAPHPAGDHMVWTLNDGRSLILSGDHSGHAIAGGVDTSGEARFVLVVVEKGKPFAVATELLAAFDTMASARKSRMEKFLNASYVRTSDDTLTQALQWMKLSLDGLMIDQRDTFAVAGLPWDGSMDLRANAQSIAGLGLATGDYPRTAAILRSLARYQDRRPGSGTYGRLADRVAGGHATYAGADVAPWFVRELYEHVVYSNDTALVRLLYPAVRMSLDGTYGSHTDRFNFLTHGPYETWMTRSPRGNRAVEMQLLWYFQQMIGSYIATFLGDTARAGKWWRSSVETSDNFALQFADTAAKTLADHLTPGGEKGPGLRPNGIMCLEMLEKEPMRYGVTLATVRNLMLPYGVSTLAGGAISGNPSYDGPAWTWLAGPVTYALTRYDRQDLGYILTKSMARVALTEDMAGTLPAILGPGPVGVRASLVGMAEYVRTFYQDYLGLRVDLAANAITIQPKLPEELTEVEFSVYAGAHRIDGSYRRTKEEGRILLDAPDLPGAMKVNVLWMMDNGNAWRGTASLTGGRPFTLVLRQDDALLFRGDEVVELAGKRLLKNFSQKTSAAELTFSGR